MATQVAENAKGGEFLLKPVTEFDIAVPADADEETRMLVQTADDFMEKEIIPKREALSKLDIPLTVSLVKKAGELGFLMLDISQEYGGLGVKKTTSMAIKEKTAVNASFSISLGVQTGIGSLPIVYFGNEQQRKEYLPKLATGELLSCYALTEPNCGSDALAVRTKAVLSEDGQHYILNGTKQFISSAGFANIAIIFAKVDGAKFTAFIVPMDSEGVSTGPEESKMGQKGSSTRQIILENVKVPVENVLGEVGKGHKIAFSILNVGRYVLGVSCVGGSKRLLQASVRYAKERQAFKQPIAAFPAIKQKLARMAARIYACESVAYRLAGDLDKVVAKEIVDEASQKQAMAAIENYSIEGAILKVFGSEMLNFVVDEAVQIHGGYGYLEEYEVCGAYRDARVNRIYEGTNEINRMLIPGMMMRKAMRGELNLFPRLEEVKQATEAGSRLAQKGTGEFAEELYAVEVWKQVFLYLAGQAVGKYGEALRDEQEVLMSLADITIALYTTETALARVAKESTHRGLAEKLARYAYYEAHHLVDQRARDLVLSLSDGRDEKIGKAIELMPGNSLNWVKTGRAIADSLIEAERYPLGF